MSDYLQSTLELKITEYFEKYVDGKIITFYKIQIYDNLSKESWILDKRYSEIDSLHKTISKLYPNIPPMPGKTLFKIKNKEQLDKRKNLLEIFLRECINRKDIESNEAFKYFLEIDKHAPDLVYNPPTIIYENNDLPLGVRDFVFVEEYNILFIVCCDMKLGSRVDAYITNVNLPWEKKTDEHISVGAVFAFKVFENKKGNTYIFEKAWAKSFPQQTGTVYFNKNSMLLGVGLDSGNIRFYKTSVESKFMDYEEVLNIRPHTNRVMGLSFDEKNNYIYSCSTDKKFILSDFSNYSNEMEIAQSLHGFTALIFEKENDRIFLTDEGGILRVFLTNTYPPALVNYIQTHTTNCIRALDIDYKKQYIFTGTNKGDISVLDLGNPGKEKLIKEISYFGGNLEIRILRYNRINHELYSGDQKGKITVWSLKTGQSIYAWQAHSGAITQMRYDEKNKRLLSMAKDKKIIYWQIPDSWVSDTVKKFEENSIREINANRAAERMKKYQNDEDDSDDDSLDGWDINP
jgi:WD40 repeat protein